MELVADEDDRHALAHEVLENAEELDGLLRRQHGGRLVEDEDVRAAIERLEDLDALLLPDGDALDALVGIDRELERVREILDAPSRGVHVEQHAGGRRLGREHDVLGHRHHRDEHEVLVHHADARARSPPSASGSATGLPLMRISPSSGW